MVMLFSIIATDKGGFYGAQTSNEPAGLYDR